MEDSRKSGQTELIKTDGNNIPEWQKELVRESIKKYSEYPELFIDEEKAWELINV